MDSTIFGPDRHNGAQHASAGNGLQDSSLQGDSLRADMYRLLAGLLAAPPGEDMLHALRSLEVEAGGAEAPAAADNPEHAEAGAMLGAWRALKDAAEHADSETLDDEYHDLFVGVSRGELMPYASWYLSGFLMSRPLALLRRDLDALGIERRAEASEPEDHVSALCEAMSLIVEHALEIPRAVQRRFFQAHVERWMGRFFTDLQHARAARFYAPVGALGERFLAIETQYLNAESADAQ